MLEEFTPEASALQLPPKRLTEDERLVAFLPGSRASEVKSLLPIMEGAADKLSKRGWHPVFSIAPGLNPKVRDMLLEKF